MHMRTKPKGFGHVQSGQVNKNLLCSFAHNIYIARQQIGDLKKNTQYQHRKHHLRSQGSQILE